MPLSFGSDNHSGVHPVIMNAMVAANTSTAPSYEMDDPSQDLKKLLRSTLNCVDSHLVFNGTAANVLSLGSALKSYESVLCTDISHLNADECGAPEKWTGGKLIAVPNHNGKMRVQDLAPFVVRKGDQHFSQVRMVSITQPTEFGTVYSFDELKAIKEFCVRENLLLHIDGARLANACVYLQCEMKDVLAFADVASVGGTKNGLLFGELVVINNPQLAKDFKFLRKQGMQLPSKTRFMAIQFLTYFKNDLWREIATHQCLLARHLEQKLKGLPQSLIIDYPVESNAVFCRLPQSIIKRLREDFFFYVWDEDTFQCRLMTSFVTQKEDVEQFVFRIQTLLQTL